MTMISKTNKSQAPDNGIARVLSCKALVQDGREPHHYYIGGSGKQTLAIINAYGQSLAFWDLLVASLVTQYRVVIWQPRGTLSRDGIMQEAFSVEDHVRDMEAIFDAEEIESAHLISWCSGAKTAIGFYARNPRHVASMLFLTGSFVHDAAARPLYSRYEDAMFNLCQLIDGQPELAGQVIDMLRGLLQAMPASADADSGPSDSDSCSANAGELNDRGNDHDLELISYIKSLVFEPFRTPHSVVNYARQLLAFRDYDVSHVFAGIRVPTLFIGGENDQITSARIARATAARMPGAMYANVRGGTHYMHCDSHRMIGDIVANFTLKGYGFDFTHSLLDVAPADSMSIEPVSDMSQRSGNSKEQSSSPPLTAAHE